MEKIFIALFSLLPALIYAYVVYITMPFKSISLRDGMRFMIAGIFSVILLKYFSVLGLDSIEPYKIISGDILNETMGYIHYKYFITIGLMEELSKLMAFFLFSWLTNMYVDRKNIHPIAIMFYCGMVGLGFAVAENVHYANYSSTPFNTLWWRSIAPVLTHMTCGFFMGYWISLSRMGPRMYNRSLFDIIIHTRPKVSKVIYTLIGLFCATILHGVYDLHLELNGIKGLSGVYILIILSSLGVLYCFNHIYILNKIKIKQVQDGETTTKKENGYQGGESKGGNEKGFGETNFEYENEISSN